MSDSVQTTDSTALRGIFPILATCFHADGGIDYASQERLIEFCIDGGVHGLVMLANASEGHLLSEAEKRDLLVFGLEKVGGRVPVIATISHPASRVAAEMAASAAELGAAAVMALPPFFGRWRAGLGEIYRHFEVLDRAIGVPIVLQDHVLTDISLPVDFLVDMAEKLNRFQYVKLESGNILHKARALRAAAGENLVGVFGGNSGIFLPEEREVGCCGTMPACYMPDVFRRTWDLLEAGQVDAAIAYFAPFSRLASYEKDVCNRCVWKELLVRRQVIACGAVREPHPPHAGPEQIAQLVRVAEQAGLLV
ncbi:MAG: dihydrodipicolinate synthase family protein [Gemmatimonadetes bacterium]|nr:dihydrodipicolinate synthase family protein [Gemmatimonadota bacterium]